jgi:branched-chain amino acid transport system ATP-binding protein
LILEANEIHTYYGPSHILFGIALSIQEGEIVTLLGRNGAGKTTTMRSIMGLTPARSGSIKFMGAEIVGKSPHVISRMGIGLVPEERRIFPDLTVRENLRVPSPRGQGGFKIEDVYDLFPNLRALDKRPGGNISGGEQQMLAIGRTLMANPRLVLMDEPAEGLSPITVSMLEEGIRKLREQKITILLSEQNIKFAMGLSQRVYIMEKGQMRYAGTIEDFKKNEEVRKRYLMV